MCSKKYEMCTQQFPVHLEYVKQLQHALGEQYLAKCCQRAASGSGAISQSENERKGDKGLRLT